ncbi:MAG: choice-of-anchor Q domain-containing protein [Solirubrobacterales bacterium]
MGSGTSFAASRRGPVVAALAAALALLGAGSAQANTIDVTTTADEFSLNNGQCALREAIYAANNDGAAPASGCTPASGADIINLPAGTYRLTIPGAGENAGATGDLDVTDFATITGSGVKPVIVDGGGIDRVLHTSSTGQTRLVGLTITGGLSPQNGGGIFNDGTLVLDRVTVVGNQGQFGGGIASSSAALTVSNSTFSGNTATSSGGGVASFGVGNATTITSTTVAGNTANTDAGGVLGGVGSTSLRSVLIAANTDTSGANAPDCMQQAGFFESSGSVLVGNNTGCGGLTTGAGDLRGVDPKLGPLASNGGPTQTHALLKGSPAINTGQGCPGFDQRGGPRKACDIGAYERIVIRKVLVNRIGSPLGDKLAGTKGRDGIMGLLGKDKLFGGKKNDVLVGGKGRDVLSGGKGFDVCLGGGGKDKYKGCEVEK